MTLGKRVVVSVAVSVSLALTATWFALDAHPSGAYADSDGASGTLAVPQGRTSSQGVQGTTEADLDAFATAFNAQRAANDLLPVPAGNIRYDPCMEERLFWMAEDPSPYVASAWGHLGSKRSDGVPERGCDGNLAGGTNNTGATVAVKWWNSLPHRAALYKPFYRGAMSEVCIYFAMTHGGVPDEPAAFTRAAARWSHC
jgi:hypothetical protein